MRKTIALTTALLAGYLAHPPEAFGGTLVIPELESWSFSVHNEETLVNEERPYDTASQPPITFTETLAHSLLGYGIGRRDSVIVVGKDLGHGFDFFVGGGFRVPESERARVHGSVLDKMTVGIRFYTSF